MFLTEYREYVNRLTSPASQNLNELINRLEELNISACAKDINITKMITGSKGMTCEAAEVEDVVKKIVFQGKPLDEETIEHIKREIGDCIFYLVMLCDSLDTSIEELMALNIEKLNARYSKGVFDKKECNERKKTDI
jgi:NTP pyrophosphatase (non-canonical NTP hydrolase)